MKLKEQIPFLAWALVLAGCVAPRPQPVASAAAQGSSQPSPSPTTVTQAPTPFFESEGEPIADLAESDDETTETAILIGEEVENEISLSHAGPGSAEVSFDIPVILNRQVEKWMDYFQNRGRKVFSAWMSRSGKYIPMMQRILREHGLPQDLVYLSMIESGFKPYAYSHAKASGPWQFIHGTGIRYGLRNDYWVDERRDPEKSTLAAAQHLKDLYDQFNNWYLAAAGYNAGAGKIERAINRYSTEDFWEMSRYSYLKPETKNYVPKILAAALLAKNPEKYGFTDIVYEEPERYSRVEVKGPTRIETVAKALGVELEELTHLNPELKRGTTPPDVEVYELKIPEGLESRFAQVYPRIQEESAGLQVARHKVRRGENLSSIARAYGVPTSQIKKENRLKKAYVRPGQTLTVSYRAENLTVLPDPALSVKGRYRHASTRSRTRSTVSRAAVQGSGLVRYKIRKGDTLWSLSRQFGVTVQEIKAWNNIRRASDLKYGRVIRIKQRKVPTDGARAKSPQQAFRMKVSDATTKDRGGQRLVKATPAH